MSIEYFKRVHQRYTPDRFLFEERSEPVLWIKNVPPGRIRMHNQVRPQVRFGKGKGGDAIGLGHPVYHGQSGFRCWTQDVDSRRAVVCDCGVGNVKHYVFRDLMKNSNGTRKGPMY
jgi:ribosomal protein L16/L10AE